MGRHDLCFRTALYGPSERTPLRVPDIAGGRTMMAEGTKKTGRWLNRSRIDVNRPYQVRFWCQELRASAGELRNAVRRAGAMVSDVRRYLSIRPPRRQA
jgi:hypothetical protein